MAFRNKYKLNDVGFEVKKGIILKKKIEKINKDIRNIMKYHVSKI